MGVGLKSAIQTKPFARLTDTFLSSTVSSNGEANSLAKPLLHHWKNRQILKTSTRTALVVGTTLGLINHFHSIVTLSLTPTEILQILITFLVPFLVATYSAVRHLQYLERSDLLSKTSQDKTEEQSRKTMDQAIPVDRSSVT